MRPRSSFHWLVVPCLLAPALACATEFSEFRIPGHRWSAWSVSFSGSASSRRQPTSSGFFDDDDRYRAQTASSSGWFLDSEDLQIDARLALQGGGIREFAQTALDYSFGVREERATTERRMEELVSLGGGARVYPWVRPVALSIRFDGMGAWSSTWYHTRRFLLDPPNRTKSDQINAVHSSSTRGQYSPSLSVGYGRVRDASGVYEAYLLEKRLLETGALTRALSAASRERVAALYTIEPAYKVPHDRPARFFWRDLEAILRDDGALADAGLDAYSVQRLEEPLALGNAFQRYVGFHVGPALGGQHVSDHRRNSFSSEGSYFVGDTLVNEWAGGRVSLFELSESHLFAGMVAEYHRPLGMRAQFDAMTSVLFPTKKRDRGIAANTSARLDYSLSDRLRTGVSINHIRTIQAQGLASQFSGWGVLARATLDYFVEDRLRLSLVTEELRGEVHGAMFASGSYRNRAVSIGLTYDLLGRLDADGLIAPVRRLSQAPAAY